MRQEFLSVCMCVCVCTHARQEFLSVCMYVCVCVYTCKHQTGRSSLVCVCTQVRQEFLSVCVCTQVRQEFLSVCMCVCVCVYTCKHQTTSLNQKLLVYLTTSHMTQLHTYPGLCGTSDSDSWLIVHIELVACHKTAIAPSSLVKQRRLPAYQQHALPQSSVHTELRWWRGGCWVR